MSMTPNFDLIAHVNRQKKASTMIDDILTTNEWREKYLQPLLEELASSEKPDYDLVQCYDVYVFKSILRTKNISDRNHLTTWSVVELIAEYIDVAKKVREKWISSGIFKEPRPSDW